MNLHIYPSTFQYESRILKETHTLAAAGIFARIVIVAMHAPGLPEYERIDANREVWRVRSVFTDRRDLFARIAKHFVWMLRVLKICWREKIDCVNCHALSVAPLAVALKLGWSASLVYDAHELETETLGMRGLRRVVAKLIERFAIGWMDRIIVVSDSIAEWYRAAYKHSHIHVVKNAPVRIADSDDCVVDLKSKLGMDGREVLFLYQGLLHRGRNIELLLDAFSRAPRDKHILFLGYGSLVERVMEFAQRWPNIHYHPAVPPSKVTRYTACADVGICLIEDCCLSYRYSMPNKLFECLGTGVPVMVSNLPDMSTLVRRYQCGWVVENNMNALLELITKLDTSETHHKRRALSMIQPEFLWDQQVPRLLSVYAGLRAAA